MWQKVSNVHLEIKFYRYIIFVSKSQMSNIHLLLLWVKSRAVKLTVSSWWFLRIDQNSEISSTEIKDDRIDLYTPENNDWPKMEMDVLLESPPNSPNKNICICWQLRNCILSITCEQLSTHQWRWRTLNKKFPMAILQITPGTAVCRESAKHSHTARDQFTDSISDWEGESLSIMFLSVIDLTGIKSRRDMD